MSSLLDVIGQMFSTAGFVPRRICGLWPDWLIWEHVAGNALVWLAALVLPWFVAIYARSGNAFFVVAIGHDMLKKVAIVQAAHHAPPGLYLILFFPTFFPAAMLAGAATPAVWATRREPRFSDPGSTSGTWPSAAPSPSANISFSSCAGNSIMRLIRCCTAA